jgi:ribosomal protein S18 acetylase RimI-like enzyme
MALHFEGAYPVGRSRLSYALVAIDAPMHIQILHATPEQLAEYARVPIAFVVREVFDSEAVERLRRGEDAESTPIPVPYQKDYDAHAGHQPTDWRVRFDTSRWIVLAAEQNNHRLGGAVVVIDDAQLDSLGGASNCAVIWDLRVAPEARRRGVGAALLRAAEHAALERGAGQLRVETQQINVPACRLYRRHNFALEMVRVGAYPDLPQEVQLIWAKPLASTSRPSGEHALRRPR